MTVVEHPTAEQARRIRAAVGATEESLARDAAAVRGWLAKQPHLPHDDLDDVLIGRLLVRCKNSVVATQRRLDGIYSVRSDIPDFYDNRDPCGPEIQQALNTVGMTVLPRLTPDLQRVSIMRLLDTDPAKFSVEAFIKAANMGQDIVIREPATAGDILIFDARGYTLAHAASATPSIIRKAISHVTRTYPARITGIHVMFPPTFADRILNIVKSFLPEKTANRIYTHSSFDTLLEHIPQELLPKDFGGQEKSSDELCALWNKKVQSYRDYFLHTEKVRSDETLRQEKRKESPLDHGIEGSFRKLDLD